MKNKPWSIIVLTVLYCLAPIGNLLLNSWRSGFSPELFARLFFTKDHISSFLVLIVIPVLLGICIYICRRWSYIVFLALMTVTLVHSFLTVQGNYSFKNVLILLLVYLINIPLVGYFMLPAIRKIYFNPKVRWWQSPPRFVSDFQSSIEQAGQAPAQGNIKNVSIGGFFIETDSTLKASEEVHIKFTFKDKNYDVLGLPVFHKSTTPAGYGIKVDARTARRNGLPRLVSIMKAEGRLVPGRTPGPEDSFTHWLRQAWRSTEAWLPRARG